MFDTIFSIFLKIIIAKDKDMVKASTFLESIVFSKRCLNDNLQPYQIALFSFQSTGATNIMTVNSVLKTYLCQVRCHQWKVEKETIPWPMLFKLSFSGIFCSLPG